MPHFDDDINANPLKQYRSYAYHHILIACDSTETALQLEQAGTITEFQRTRESQRNRELKYAGQPIRRGSQDKNFVILIDGLVDADFYITDASWTSVVSPTTQGAQSTMETEGSLTIFEPYGAVFLERLVNVCSELGTDPNGLVFLLKTVFVGYNDDDHQYNVEMMSDIRPMLFVITNITSVMDETGAEYQFEIFGVNDGFSKLPQASNIGKGFSVAIDPSVPLETTLKEAMDEVNNQYIEFARNIEGVIVNNDNQFAPESSYRPVTYSVSAPEYATNYFAGTQLNTNSDDTVNTKVLHFGENTTVEKMLETIMRSSAEVEADSKRDGDDKYIFKVNSYLRSTPEGVDISYQINRYRVPVQPYSSQVANAPETISEDQIKTYNYIFTGKNTDILELDVKMNYGMAFFHTAASTAAPSSQDEQRVLKEQGQAVGSGSIGHAASNSAAPRTKTPLFLGDKTTDPYIRNSKDPVTSATFQSLLERHAAVENISCTMKIHGDPTLLNETLTFDNTPLSIDNAGQTANVAFNSQLDTYRTKPILFRVNIQMPVDSNRQEFRPFWYRGLYVLHRVEHLFKDGEFTQTVTMFSVPTSTDVMSPPDAESPTKGETNEQIGDGSSSGQLTGSTEEQSVRDVINGNANASGEQQ